MTKSAALTTFQLGYECCPIILTNGVAQLMFGGMLPIIALTESVNFLDGLLGGGSTLNPDNFFAKFKPLPGGKLISNKYGTYTFANQATAANAVIAEPVPISLLMTCPAKKWAAKLATITLLKSILEQHSNMGGAYTVVTPSYFLTGCLLKDLTYVGDGGKGQTQALWQWDFFQPLTTEQQAAATFNGMMQRINGGLPSTGALSGPETILGNPTSLAAGALFPSASTSPAAMLSSGVVPL